ncbi:PLP-dependent aminotransferase family protein, partial [Kitasatospora sp. A2-31]|nr:PLP-dependent aminotransferase family protein [Kitasatospora sp. A2-31]
MLTTPEQVVITTGFYQSVGLLGRVPAAEGVTTVAMEDPGHNTYREVVRRVGLTTSALTVDAGGARPRVRFGQNGTVAANDPVEQE